jgi:hypothetical protein
VEVDDLFLGFIIEFFFVHGHSLKKEVSPFWAKQAPPIKCVMQPNLSFDLATFVAQKLKDSISRGKFNSSLSGVVTFHCKRWMKVLQLLLQSLRWLLFDPL